MWSCQGHLGDLTFGHNFSLALPQEMILCGLNNLWGSWLNRPRYQQNEIVLHNIHYLQCTILEKSWWYSAGSLRSASCEPTKRNRSEMSWNSLASAAKSNRKPADSGSCYFPSAIEMAGLWQIYANIHEKWFLEDNFFVPNVLWFSLAQTVDNIGSF